MPSLQPIPSKRRTLSIGQPGSAFKFWAACGAQGSGSLEEEKREVSVNLIRAQIVKARLCAFTKRKEGQAIAKQSWLQEMKRDILSLSN
jgi:hypothetical protein